MIGILIRSPRDGRNRDQVRIDRHQVLAGQRRGGVPSSAAESRRGNCSDRESGLKMPNAQRCPIRLAAVRFRFDHSTAKSSFDFVAGQSQ